DRGLPRRAVAQDQLALAAPDRDQRVDRLEARLQRLLDRLAVDDAGRLELEQPALCRLDRRPAVEGVPERVDDPPDQLLPHGDARHPARPPRGLALLDLIPWAEEGGADVVLLKVEGEAGHSVLELEHLHGHRTLEAVDAGDSVSDLEHGADLGQVGLDRVVLDALLEDGGDLFWS